MLGDNIDLLPGLADESFQLIYIDPPFNTGRTQRRQLMTAAADPDGDRAGFGGRRYPSQGRDRAAVADSHDDYLGLLEPRPRAARRLAPPTRTPYRPPRPPESHH